MQKMLQGNGSVLGAFLSYFHSREREVLAVLSCNAISEHDLSNKQIERELVSSLDALLEWHRANLNSSSIFPLNYDLLRVSNNSVKWAVRCALLRLFGSDQLAFFIIKNDLILNWIKSHSELPLIVSSNSLAFLKTAYMPSFLSDEAKLFLCSLSHRNACLLVKSQQIMDWVTTRKRSFCVSLSAPILVRTFLESMCSSFFEESVSLPALLSVKDKDEKRLKARIKAIVDICESNKISENRKESLFLSSNGIEKNVSTIQRSSHNVIELSRHEFVQAIEFCEIFSERISGHIESNFNAVREKMFLKVQSVGMVKAPHYFCLINFSLENHPGHFIPFSVSSSFRIVIKDVQAGIEGPNGKTFKKNRLIKTALACSNFLILTDLDSYPFVFPYLVRCFLEAAANEYLKNFNQKTKGPFGTKIPKVLNMLSKQPLSADFSTLLKFLNDGLDYLLDWSGHYIHNNYEAIPPPDIPFFKIYCEIFLVLLRASWKAKFLSSLIF